jgi:hypothetical protein
MSSLKPLISGTANDPNTQIAGPEDKHDRDHKGMGRPGVDEN